MRIRESARIVLIDDHDRVFLFEHHSPTLRYWVTPGGGVEEGESWEATALRELWEETGIDNAPLGPWLWSREGDVQYANDILSHERYYLVRCPTREITDAHQLDNERRVYQRHHWWTLDELRATGDIVYPIGLAELIAPILEGEIPAEPVQLAE